MAHGTVAEAVREPPAGPARPAGPPTRAGALATLRRRISRDRYLLLLISPVVAYYVLFYYVPMAGTLVAFEDYIPTKGVLGSDWVGFANFEQLFHSYYFGRIVTNTVLLSVYSIIFGFPAPLIFALILNEVKNRYFKRVAQTISYLPHFISVVVVAGMIVTFLSPTGGIVNNIRGQLGLGSFDYMSDPSYFRPIYVISGIWQEFGWGAIIYLAALAGIDPALYDAADVDGAKRWQKTRHVTLPGLVPVTTILLILSVGNLMVVGFEKVLLLYNPAIYQTADVIQTYVYRSGIVSANYGFAAAVGLFNSVINLILLVTVNYVAKRVSDVSLW